MSSVEGKLTGANARQRRPRRRPRCTTLSTPAAVVAGFMLAISPGRAEPSSAYALQPGDTIQISVAGVPDLRESVPVQPDGTISFPLLGTLKVEGLSTAELQQQIQTAFAGKIYRNHPSGGQETLIVIRPEEVSASIVAYRPVYVTGGVSRPGEIAFRPGLTVREALALAGGNRVSPFSAEPLMQLLSTKGDMRVLWLKLAKERAHIAALTSELNSQESIQFPDETALPSQLVTQIHDQETDLLKAEIADGNHQTAFLQTAVKQDDQQIAILSQQQQQEETGAKEDQDNLEFIGRLLKRGDVTSNLVSEARRDALVSSTRTLQVTAQLLQAKTQKMTNMRRLEELQDKLRISLLDQIGAATQELNATRAGLEASKEKVAYLTEIIPEALSVTDAKPQITLIRGAGTNVTRSVVDEDAALQPGDVIDVSPEPGSSAELQSP